MKQHWLYPICIADRSISNLYCSLCFLYKENVYDNGTIITENETRINENTGIMQINKFLFKI
jgi:hypothetical protein